VTDLQARPTPEVTGASIEHFVCCVHEHRTYCGLHDTNPVGDPADEVECVVCNDLAEDDRFCPVMRHCPYGGDDVEADVLIVEPGV
jgi:hypothetical protein